MNTSDPIASDWRQSVSDRLNQTCLCVTLDRVALGKALEREAGDPAFVETFIRPRPHLFSNVPVFLSADAVAEMQDCVVAIEATTRLPSYQAAVLSWAPQIAQQDPAAMRNCQRRTRIGGRVNSRWFKLEAVRLIKERGVTVAQASRDLGEDLVSPSA
jgi:hypothetical protein